MRVEGGIATDGGLKLLHEDMAVMAGIDKDDSRTWARFSSHHSAGTLMLSIF
jgi:hypothetical protein